MHERIINKKEAMDFQESKNEHMGGFGGRKGKGEMT